VLGRKIGDRQRECAETVEANHAESIVDGDENPRHTSFLVLPGAKMDPVIQRRDATRKRTPFVLAERLDGFDHERSIEETAMALEGLDEAWSRFGGAVDRRDKSVAIRAHQNHALMFFEQPPRALIGEVPSREPGDGHGLMNHFLCRGSQTQLQTLRLEFPLLRCWFL